MARNIEIKARLTEARRTRRLIESCAPGPHTTLEQEDVFFRNASGRLKLRIFPGDQGELIHYRRHDQPGPKLSDYQILKTGEAAQLRDLLGRAYGVLAVVRKRRHLYLLGRTRIHLDEVEQLGDFLELEAVLAEHEDLAAGEQEVEQLMDMLQIAPEHLVSDAYVDLLLTQRGRRPQPMSLLTRGGEGGDSTELVEIRKPDEGAAQ